MFSAIAFPPSRRGKTEKLVFALLIYLYAPVKEVINLKVVHNT